jgi:hypothetical protein
MSVCEHTGLAVPECSCGACIQAQLEQHMPSSLDSSGLAVAPDADSGPTPPAAQQRAA